MVQRITCEPLGVLLGSGELRLLASYRQRAWARCLDALPAVTLLVLSAVLGSTWWGALAGVAGVAFVGFYDVVMLSLSGRTWGKRLMGIEVVQVGTGESLSWTQSLSRWFTLLLPNAVPFAGQLFALAAMHASTWDHRRRGWHDRAGRSVVVVDVRIQKNSGLRDTDIEVATRGDDSKADSFRALAAHPLVRLFGKGMIFVPILILVVVFFVDRTTIRNTLNMGITPLAVIFAFGLKEFRQIDECIAASWPGSDTQRSHWLASLLTYGGSISALVAALLYNLVPEMSSEGLFRASQRGGWYTPLAVEGQLWSGLLLSVVDAMLVAVVVMFVAMPFVLIIRYRRVGMAFVGTPPPSMRRHWRRRWTARWLDIGVVLVLGTADIFLLYAVGGDWKEYMRWMHWPYWALAYEASMALTRGRLTVGKRLHGVQVVTLDGTIPSRWQACARAVVLHGPLVFLSALAALPWFGQGFVQGFGFQAGLVVLYALATLHPRGRGLHDIAAGTCVVSKDDPPRPHQTAQSMMTARAHHPLSVHPPCLAG